MSHVIQHDDVVIANGETVQTGYIDTYGYLIAGIIVPAEFDGTAITFQAAPNDGGSPGTFLGCYNDAGTELSVTCAASRHVLIEPQTFAGARYVKLVAGTAQTGDTTLKVVKHRES